MGAPSHHYLLVFPSLLSHDNTSPFSLSFLVLPISSLSVLSWRLLLLLLVRTLLLFTEKPMMEDKEDTGEILTRFFAPKKNERIGRSRQRQRKKVQEVRGRRQTMHEVKEAATEEQKERETREDRHDVHLMNARMQSEDRRKEKREGECLFLLPYRHLTVMKIGSSTPRLSISLVR